jgi:Caspase domain
MVSTMPNLFALIVGIDNYPDPVPSLRGCVNDAKAFREVLERRYGVPPTQIVSLIDGDATREAVIRGSREHLTKAQAGDIAVFFYAGHGSQEPPSNLFIAIEPDGKNETLVCYDSRTSEGYDLVDKDVATLIHQVAAGGARLTLILDSCHSGSADRAVGDEEQIPRGVRRLKNRDHPQPESAYLVSPAAFIAAQRNMGAASSNTAGTGQAQGFVQGTAGAHVLFAACSDYQSANEYPPGNAFHGAFTYCLLQVLQDGQPLGNEEVFTRTQRLLRPLYPLQSPHLVVVGGDELRASQFLGLTPSPRGNFFIVSCDQGTWKIDGGGLQSLGAQDAVAIFPVNATPDDLKEVTRALTAATLIAAGPSESTLAVADASKLDPQQQYKAVITARGCRIDLLLDGDAAALATLRAALAASPLLHEGTPPRFVVHAAADGYRIEVPARQWPVPGPFVATQQGIAAIVDALEHMAKWITRVELSNPLSKIPIDTVDLAISYYDISGKFHGQLVPPLETLNLQYKGNQPPSFRLRITNRGPGPLYFALLACNGDWGVATDLLAEECTMLDATQELFPGGDGGIPMQLKPGVTEAHDHIVLLISTDWFDAAPVGMPNLTGPGTRDFGQKPLAAPTPAGDFATRHFEIVTRR